MAQGVLISDVITAIGKYVNAWDKVVCSTIKSKSGIIFQCIQTNTSALDGFNIDIFIDSFDKDCHIKMLILMFDFPRHII